MGLGREKWVELANWKEEADEKQRRHGEIWVEGKTGKEGGESNKPK
jgi:hypothetical protein